MKHQAGPSAGVAIQRDNMFANAVIADGQSMSGIMDFQQFAGGNVITPLTLNANTVLGFQVAEQETGPYYPLYDEYGQLVYIPVSIAASRAYVLPAALFGACYVKLWTCTTAGVNVAQTGSKGFTVMMKG